MDHEPGAGSVQVLYLEPDDELTSVVRRLADAAPGGVILVAPGRARATSSALGLRLLARRAAQAGVSLRLVADPAARLLAGEAGIAAFASLAEAQAADGAPPVPGDVPPRPRAAIHVVRGDRSARGERLMAPVTAAPAMSPGGPAGAASAAPTAMGEAPIDRAAARHDDTQAVPVVVAPSRPKIRRGVPRLRRPRGARAWAWIVGSGLVLLALVAATLPGATIHIVPRGRAVGPFSYAVQLAATTDSGTLHSTLSAPATGEHVDATPSKGAVTFANYDATAHTVPKGTHVSAGALVFLTDAAIRVDAGVFTIGGIAPGTASVGVTAAAPGPDSNVAANAIDTVDDAAVADQLGGPFGFRRTLVRNPAPTSGGTSTTSPEITAKDVQALVGRIEQDLRDQLDRHLQGGGPRVYAAAAGAEDPNVNVPNDLVGTTGTETFELEGTLAYARRFATEDEVRQATVQAMSADPEVTDHAASLVESSVVLRSTAAVNDGQGIRATVSASGVVVPLTDESDLKARVAGKSRADAVAELSSIGTVTVDLWPGWVGEVPRLPFRIVIDLEAPTTPSLPAAPTPTPPTAAPS